MLCWLLGGVEELKSHQSQDDVNCVDSDYNFNPYYFMILPQYLIITHKPVEDLWQFTDKSLTLKQFYKKMLMIIAIFIEEYINMTLNFYHIVIH